MHTTKPVSVAVLTLALAACRQAPAETTLRSELVVSGLTRPLYVTAPPGEPSRLFIVEQRDGTTGRIKIFNLDSGSLNAAVFLNVPGVSTGNEQGLLGLAFDPDYASNGYFYVNFTDSGWATHVRRYTVSGDPDVADPNSGLDLLQIAQPFSNHNGGWMGFGPDGYLYIATGDGGDGGDPFGNAQDITDNLLGKLLRIDVDGDDFPADPARNYAIPAGNPFVGLAGDDEIWAYGLRNPWRCSFDRGTGDLIIGDVGQGAWEELDFQPAASTGGENYGWRCYEGNHAYNTAGCADPNTMVFPIHEYSHGSGCSITGGYVYRGGEICDLQGTYFFADYCTATIWSFRIVGGAATDLRNRTAELAPGGGLSIASITSFGEDARGELYIVDRGGEVFRITRDGPAKGDMNNNDTIGFDDINPFVLALTNLAAYTAQHGLDPAVPGDLNCDLTFDFGDINPFVDVLTGP